MMSSKLLGESPRFQDVLDAIAMVAPVDSAVLLQGETGTGKELIARAIHDASSRHQQRFVAVNCAAIPAALLESELFGHERGAFTGAVTQVVGRFQAADRGTLFLDEIGELPLELQPKLLRALQEQQIERLGGGRTTQINVRVIAATNRDLLGMVQERTFRADLYYRLNVFPITVPPLRERKEDIPLLADHFVKAFAEQQGKVIDTIPGDTLRSLKQYHWPGNIRELQNIIERGVIVTKGRVLEAPILPGSSQTLPTIATLADAERAHIIAVLRESNWTVGGWNGAAARLGIPRTTLISKMQRLGLSRAPAEPQTGRPQSESSSFPSDLRPHSDKIRSLLERDRQITETRDDPESAIARAGIDRSFVALTTTA